MLYKVSQNSNHGLFSELPSPSTRVRHALAAAAAHPLNFEVSRCRTSIFKRCFLPAQARMWNILTFTLFDTGRLDGFKGTVNIGCLPELCFSVFGGASACGNATIYK